MAGIAAFMKSRSKHYRAAKALFAGHRCKRSGERLPRVKRVLLYYHHLGSLGHTQLAFIFARAIKRAAPRTDVLLIGGGKPTPGWDPPEGIEYVQLPSLVNAAGLFDGLRPGALSLPVGDILKMRKEMLMAVVRSYRPHVMITEHFPFGRWSLRGEIVPMLRYARMRLPGCTIISSMWDLAATPERIWRERRRATNGHLRKYYDHIFVHGDPRLAEFDLDLAPDVRQKLVYTGYLASKAERDLLPRRRMRPGLVAGRRFLVVASVGGGKDGYRLLDNVLAAERILNKRRAQYRFLVFTGPFMAGRDFQKLLRRAKGRIRVERFSAELLQYVHAADLTISMGGYNSCAEMLLTRSRAIIVPRICEQEQWMRASLWRRHRLARLIHPNILTPRRLSVEIQEGIKAPRPKHSVDIAGAECVGRLIRKLRQEPGLE